MRNHVWVAPGPNALCEQINEIAALVGVRVETGERPGPGAALAVVFLDTPPVEVPAIAVGPGTDLALPADAALLAQAFGEVGPPAPEHKTPEILVAAWNGGGGATTLVVKLAGVCRATILDASGTPHGRSRVPISWEQIDATDPPHLGQYRHSNGEPAVMSARGTCIGAGDRRVAALAACVAGRVVVDCGVWNPAVDQLAQVLPQSRLVLVGTPQSYPRLVEIVDCARVWPAAIVSTSTSAPELQRIAAHTGSQLFKRRQVKTLWEAING